MKNYIPLNRMLRNFKKKSVNAWFDRLSFLHIFIIWAVVIIIFGVAYHSLTKDNSYLYQSIGNKTSLSVFDAVYFSFITATTTGFGDIIPFGGFRILALVEVVCGLLLLAFVTSKLVSIKQDIILNEVYEISLSEKISRIRASLLLFRQNINRVMQRIEEGTIKKREIVDMYTYISPLEDSLHQIITLFTKSKSNNFTKEVDPVNAELIFISIIQSLEKLLELINLLENQNIEWRREITVSLINNSTKQSLILFENITTIKSLSNQSLKNLKSQAENAVQNINKIIEFHKKKEKDESDKKDI
ncbi:MAG: potassium channel family protein [Candidatus Nanoarchaeia archaeon]|nr:potassium channel family protein [Candidatus Nanoarchaeia archaeon]